MKREINRWPGLTRLGLERRTESLIILPVDSDLQSWVEENRNQCPRIKNSSFSYDSLREKQFSNSIREWGSQIISKILEKISDTGRKTRVWKEDWRRTTNWSQKILSNGLVIRTRFVSDLQKSSSVLLDLESISEQSHAPRYSTLEFPVYGTQDDGELK